VIVVLGYHDTGDPTAHRISRICRAGVRRAEALAAEAAPRAVVFTGWAAGEGPSEAEQMAEAWGGRRDVPLLLEPRAENTAENAARSLALVRRLDGVSEVVVVCSVRHFPRARFLFARLYARHGYAVRYAYVWSPRPSLRLALTELGSISRMVGDRREAARLLDPTPPYPGLGATESA
jgi:uncharacterized SAM-binding protein YcdF (DUF218 family)